MASKVKVFSAFFVVVGAAVEEGRRDKAQGMHSSLDAASDSEMQPLDHAEGETYVLDTHTCLRTATLCAPSGCGLPIWNLPSSRNSCRRRFVVAAVT